MCPIHLCCRDLSECLRANWLHDVCTGTCRAAQHIAASMWLMGCRQIPICMHWLKKTNHCERRSIKLSEISRGSMLHDACPPLVGALNLFNVLHYWRLSHTDTLQPKTWRFFPVSLVTPDPHTSPSHYPATSPLTQSWLCSPLFEVAQECSANSWPQEDRTSLESAMCQIG